MSLYKGACNSTTRERRSVTGSATITGPVTAKGRPHASGADARRREAAATELAADVRRLLRRRLRRGGYARGEPRRLAGLRVPAAVLRDVSRRRHGRHGARRPLAAPDPGRPDRAARPRAPGRRGGDAGRRRRCRLADGRLDRAPPCRSSRSPRSAAGPWWFQIYAMRDGGLSSTWPRGPCEAGASALVLTGDTPFVGIKARPTPGARRPERAAPRQPAGRTGSVPRSPEYGAAGSVDRPRPSSGGWRRATGCRCS